ncbi:hypothetical protein KSH70_026885, partial [Escherichia coli]|nr:hypothetical protein [Escherichia coli]
CIRDRATLAMDIMEYRLVHSISNALVQAHSDNNTLFERDKDVHKLSPRDNDHHWGFQRTRIHI